ncbi:MAG: preprotein translocase subunit SecE [Candidatus Paceibacterota bacterium]|jgi:preprotein translocase SecE subunit
MFKKIKQFFEDARQEFKSVNWPTRAEAIRLTFVVIGISIGMAIFLGVFDTLFSYIIKSFVAA